MVIVESGFAMYAEYQEEKLNRVLRCVWFFFLVFIYLLIKHQWNLQLEQLDYFGLSVLSFARSINRGKYSFQGWNYSVEACEWFYNGKP